MNEEQPDNVVPLRAVESGTVKKSIVLEVLKAHGVSVVQKANDIVLTKGSTVEVQRFPPRLHRRMLH